MERKAGGNVMPKTKAIGLYADRKEAVRRVINIGLARSGLTGRDLDRRNIININLSLIHI